MNTLSRLLTIAAVVTCIATPVVFAQSEKINLRMPPRPDQTVRTTMTQEMDFDVSMDGAAAELVKMGLRATIAMTQTVGARKPDGTVDAEVTYDRISTEMSMNGQAMPANNAGSDLVGKAVTVTYGADGSIVDVQGMQAAGPTGDLVRQMMTSLQGNMPVIMLAVGESGTTPLDMALPLPLPGTTGMKITGETTMKLIAIDTGPEGRSARLTSTTHGKMATGFASPAGQGQFTVDMSTDGDGTSVLDLDNGVLRSSVTNTTVNGKINSSGGAPAQTANMTMRGTMKVTITSARLSGGK